MLKNWTNEDHRLYALDGKARGMLLITAVPVDVYKTIEDLDTVKKMMDELTLVCEGNEETENKVLQTSIKATLNPITKPRKRPISNGIDVFHYIY